MKPFKSGLLFLSLGGIILSSPLQGRTKMTTLPDRDHIGININNEGYSLVEEERIITLQKGTNRLDFSWAGVSIHPDSIVLQILDHPEAVRLVATEFPPGENALIFQVYSDEPFQEKMRMTYLLSGLSSQHSYYAITENNEKTLAFNGFLRLYNHSGEDFRQSTLNLPGQPPLKKELESGESKQFLTREAPKVGVKKLFVWDSRKQPHDPEKQDDTPGIPLFYEMINQEDQGLGKFPIPYGKMRIYQKDKQGETAFIGEDWLKFTPVDEKFKLYLGDSRDISVRRRVMKTKDSTDRTDSYNNVVLYHKDDLIRYDLHNFKNEKVELTLVDYFDGYWVISDNNHPFEKKDHQTVEFKLTLDPGAKIELNFNVQFKNLRR